MQLEHFLLPPTDTMPNNRELPVVAYRAALVPADVTGVEALFVRNGWPPQWRNGIYGFHHYHTEGHEALGVATGSARVLLGGEPGREVTLAPGDVLVLPAGTGHCRVAASANFLVVGAYPPGQGADICCDAPDAAMLERIAGLPLPDSDPVAGPDGPLPRLWGRR